VYIYHVGINLAKYLIFSNNNVWAMNPRFRLSALRPGSYFNLPAGIDMFGEIRELVVAFHRWGKSLTMRGWTGQKSRPVSMMINMVSA